jgi:hypothetical protein
MEFGVWVTLTFGKKSEICIQLATVCVLIFAVVCTPKDGEMSFVFNKLFGRDKRTLKFRVTLTIHELTQVPLNNSIVFVKWKVCVFGS